MKNLLPLESQKILRRRYLMRASTVLFAFVSVSVLTTSVLIAPSYVNVRSQRAYREKELETIQTALRVRSRDEAPRDERIDEKTNTLSHFIRGMRVTDSVAEIIERKPRGVSLTNLSYERHGEGEKEIRVSGVASRRDDLIAFRDRLTTVFSRVDLPVSYLAADRNITFSLILWGSFE